MALTQLSHRKAAAYSVNLRLEEREQVCPGSPQACCWDSHGDRYLFARDVWRYTVIEGTDEIYNDGWIDTELVAAPAPLSSAAEGTVLRRLDRVATADVPGESRPPYTGLRSVDVLAADAETGHWIVYSHRSDVSAPYVTELHAFDLHGGALGSAALPQPDDGAPRWRVPHAILVEGWVYAIERDAVWRPEPGPAVGRVVRRGVLTLGSLIHWWAPGDDWIYPHSLSVGEGGWLYVVVTKLFNPGPDSFQGSYLAWLHRDDLAEFLVFYLSFGLITDGPVPYYLGEWQSAGDRNTGGLCIHDGTSTGEEGEESPCFVASALSPNGYNPDWAIHPPETGFFRFEFAPPGNYLTGLGAPMPVPMSRTPTGVCGNLQGQLPELRDL